MPNSRTIIVLIASLLTGCSPIYTWGYADTVHPNATSAYIRAVMARENGDYKLALDYYNLALKYTDSPNVRTERDEVASMLK